jgi:hypothetical protein
MTLCAGGILYVMTTLQDATLAAMPSSESRTCQRKAEIVKETN